MADAEPDNLPLETTDTPANGMAREPTLGPMNLFFSRTCWQEKENLKRVVCIEDRTVRRPYQGNSKAPSKTMSPHRLREKIQFEIQEDV
jgi:hypothetical protein